MAGEDTVLKQLDTVIADLEARQDYSSVAFAFVCAKQSVTAVNAVQKYTDFKQALLVQQADGPPVGSFALATVQSITSAIISSNLQMQKMGQLNTDRTISPKTADSNNAGLKLLQSGLMGLVAGLASGPINPSPTQMIYGPKGT